MIRDRFTSLTEKADDAWTAVGGTWAIAGYDPAAPGTVDYAYVIIVATGDAPPTPVGNGFDFVLEAKVLRPDGATEYRFRGERKVAE